MKIIVEYTKTSRECFVTMYTMSGIFIRQTNYCVTASFRHSLYYIPKFWSKCHVAPHKEELNYLSSINRIFDTQYLRDFQSLVICIISFALSLTTHSLYIYRKSSESGLMSDQLHSTTLKNASSLTYTILIKSTTLDLVLISNSLVQILNAAMTNMFWL